MSGGKFGPCHPAKLATRALTGCPTALRWLKIHHPELLVKPDEASVAVAPVAPEPKPTPPKPNLLPLDPEAFIQQALELLASDRYLQKAWASWQENK